MRQQTVIQAIASAVQARKNCEISGNGEWFTRWTEELRHLEREYLPSGSGIDSGTTIDLDRSSGSVVYLNTSFHHMHESGMYDGWTEHTITVRPAFDGIEITVGGRNRNEIKEYLGDVFYTDLQAPYVPIATENPKIAS